MITVYECLQHYYSLPDAVVLSNKKIKRLCKGLANVYDRSYERPVEYIERVEEKGTFNVRNYPDSFKKVIDTFIWNAHKRTKEEMKLAPTVKPVEKLAAAPVEQTIKPKRKRIPIKQ